MTKRRCDWCKGDHLYENYHDNVWGVPVFEDNILFESLTLEIFQSGLSWITILKKRDGFLKAFDSFDINKISAYDIKKENELIANTNIVRNNLKIKATINNAKAIIRIQEEYNSFSKYIWTQEGIPATARMSFVRVSSTIASTFVSQSSIQLVSQLGILFFRR